MKTPLERILEITRKYVKDLEAENEELRRENTEFYVELEELRERMKGEQRA